VKLQIEHVTHYVYDAPVRHSTQYLRMVPASGPRQTVIEWKLETPGKPVETRDGYGNIMHVLTLETPVLDIRIRAVGTVETRSGPDDIRDEGSLLSPLVFLRPTPRTAADEAIVGLAERYRRRAGTLTGLRDLSLAVHGALPFQPGVTTVHSTAAEALAAGSGVCQDHAHVFIAACRALGIPARYVSGYLFTINDAHVASHAWAEAWVVDRWRTFDVTNGGPAGETHIRIAIGADYLDASPVRGVRRGGGDELMSARAIVSSQ